MKDFASTFTENGYIAIRDIPISLSYYTLIQVRKAKLAKIFC